jgi:metalloendopeptidase OMA1, mitochondrial
MLRRSWSSLVAVAVCVIASVSGCETVPMTGRSQLQLVSPDQEAQMGADAYKEILGKAKLSADSSVNALVNRVGTRIAAATGRKDLAWEFTAIDDPKTANAFALPGGKVAVYTGILPVTRDEAGLAAVLGHEVAHVLARHSAERISRQLALQFGVDWLGGAVGVNPQLTQAGGAILVSAIQLPWGRSQESEADHLGLLYMAKAGYDPHAARDLWVRMAQAGKGSSRPPEFLSTHPSEETRIQQIDAWLPEALRYYTPPR